jgi:hypothetical protein
VYVHTIAMTHYTRGVALAVLGRTTEAVGELARFKAAAKRVPAEHVLHNNTCTDLLQIAEHMLTGELNYRLGR